MLIAYVQSWANWQQAQKLVNEQGQTLAQPVLDRHGQVVGSRYVKNPAVTIVQHERAACIRVAALFGFNPLDRERISAAPAPEEPSAWDEL